MSDFSRDKQSSGLWADLSTAGRQNSVKRSRFLTRSFWRLGLKFKSHGHCVKVYGSWVKVKVKGMAGELSSCDGDRPLRAVWAVVDHTEGKQRARCSFSGKDEAVTEWILGLGYDAEQWDLAGCGMLYFVNILINILAPIVQSLYGPNHQGQHMRHTDESDRENKSPRSLL